MKIGEKGGGEWEIFSAGFVYVDEEERAGAREREAWVIKRMGERGEKERRRKGNSGSEG